MAEFDQTYAAIVAECAAQGRALMQQLANAGSLEPLYLYCRPSTEKENGRLYLVRDSAPNPHGYQLVTGEGLRANVPYSQYHAWVAERARRAPLYAFGR